MVLGEGQPVKRFGMLSPNRISTIVERVLDAMSHKSSHHPPSSNGPIGKPESDTQGVLKR
jgi:hypothetical protein